MSGVNVHLGDFLNLLFPAACCTCGSLLLKGERVLCTECRINLPKTNYHKDRENPVERIFWGRIPVSAATAYFFFEPGSRYKNIIYKLKYGGMQKIGRELGRNFGNEVKAVPAFSQADCIIPVPLHTKKERKRGFNQSRLIAEGMSEVLNIPVILDVVSRTVNTPTQTRKNRISRWENVDNIFTVTDPDAVKGKHIMLVDDLVTTGATLEACGKEILEINSTTISIAVLAMA